ncbi:MAG: aminotransferase class V-fold PLP-dependent enzyme [Deltaproteobacteria bacterium]|nr:aminotransferase class V-fold PLP-dependent enzyme [Deltaproteobacteria bacterium]
MPTPLDPAALRPHYRAFLTGGRGAREPRDRVLLTGHSHQAWPDVARAAVLEAFDDAAALVDDKWGRAFAAADAVRLGVATRIGCTADEIALAPNTHELVARFLSCLDLRRRPHLVTTAGEFHTIDRQLRRLAEEGVEITWVDPREPATLAARIASAVRGDTAAVLCSTVLFQTSAIVPGVDELVRTVRARGVEVLLDAYHAFSFVPFRVPAGAFLVAGGYKYAQLGEGNCFLRVPPDTALRPVYTGWYAGFGALADPRDGGRVPYPARPAERFAGSTYDPTSHYRARAVFGFFDAQGMTVERLRATSLRQTARILAGLEGFDVHTPRDDAARAGFVAVRVRDAKAVVDGLRAQGILVDVRGDLVRLGPAPYLTDDEIDRGVAALRALAR